MMMPWEGGYEQHKATDYKKYKAEKFEKNKQKILLIIKGISQTSLKLEDQKKLLAEIKKIVDQNQK